MDGLPEAFGVTAMVGRARMQSGREGASRGMRGRIFISYRRDDAPGDARSIRDRLAGKFGKSNVFMDVDNLLAGQRFDRQLDKALAGCDVLIAIMGHRWMELLAEKTKNAERDYAREEIAAALKRDIVVIPVLVGHEGRMPTLPRSKNLPKEIRDLAMHQKHSVAHESFGRDVDDLIVAINAMRRGEEPIHWRRLLAAAAMIVLIVAAAALAYWSNMTAWLQPRPNEKIVAVGAAVKNGADEDAARRVALEAEERKKAQQEASRTVEETKRKADEDATRRRAEEDATRRKAEGEARLVTDCDRRAASPTDASRPSTIPGVDFAKIETNGAKIACDEAMRRHPEIARFVFQAGRVANAQKDYVKAVEYYRAAIAKGSVAAMSNLGNRYAHGEGVAQDYAEARKWYEQAATKGDPGAMHNLALLYDNGQGVERNYVEARKWYAKATELGNANAMTNLGLLYERGNGVAQDYSEARRWYENAAALGNAVAMYNLGGLYEEGHGVTKDLQQARKWYQRAVDAGDEDAKASLARLK